MDSFGHGLYNLDHANSGKMGKTFILNLKLNNETRFSTYIFIICAAYLGNYSFLSTQRNSGNDFSINENGPNISYMIL